jgi:hypothetical protein
MQNYGYRGITTKVPGIAGTIERGNLAAGQRKGERFVLSAPVTITLNRTDGVLTHITVLDDDGAALARIAPNAIF